MLSFNGQKPGESIKILIKANTVIFLLPGIKFVISTAIFTVACIYRDISFLLPYPALAFLAYASYKALEAFFIYKNTQTVVTNKRVISIDQRGFWNKKISESSLDKIQEIATVKKGVLNTLLQCGDIEIHTSNSQESIILIKNVNDPYPVQQKIVHLIGS